jgi:hypothetical protein
VADERDVDPSEDLFRRIAFNDVRDGEVQASAFSLRKDEEYLSVDIASLTTPETCRAFPNPPRPDLGIAVIRVSDVVALGLRVVYDEHPPERNPAHGKIMPASMLRQTPVKRQLARRARILIAPTPRGM